MEHKELADTLFPSVDGSVEKYAQQYPPRNLPTEAKVTRFGPSPTGFLHLGGLFTALVSERLAHQTGGVFFVRIEDTDKKREIEGGVDIIMSSLDAFGVRIDESIVAGGAYGPYKQSERKDMYNAFAKHLIAQGQAYPCFCTSEELEQARVEQESQKVRPGYYGTWAHHRDISLDEVTKNIAEGKPFVVRLMSHGSEHKKAQFKDLIKGDISVTENDIDVVLLKSDGLPTYHFAHVIDDHFMGTTHVVRGDEWLSSLPIHTELFSILGWNPPAYAHVSPILKSDNGGKRKLSKRKDPEAAVEYYTTEGYPHEAVIEYLLNIANSDFEDWRTAHPTDSSTSFEVRLEKFHKSGALFDIEKLRYISKLIVSKLSAEEVYARTLTWATSRNQMLAEKMKTHKDYFLKILSIERGVEKPRKDIGTWSEIEENVFYFFDDLFRVCVATGGYEYPEHIDVDVRRELLTAYKDFYTSYASKDEWFAELKHFAEARGFSSDMKVYKEHPEQYRGSISDVAMILRVAITSKSRTPDLYEVLNVMGIDAVRERLQFSASA